MSDTITAIATATGRSAINIIRLSGPSSIEIVNDIFKGADLTKVETHTIHYGFIMENEEKIDEVLVSVFHAPKSYTGEDIVEINCHGSIASTNKILELVLRKCRLAEPGEFIKRAFLNGKKDLLEAESVADLINAETESKRKMSMKGITGELTKKINSLCEKILNIIANIEVNIDYPEYEDVIIYTNELLEKSINEIKKDLTKILDESKKGKIIKNGITVGIVGKPNVGKSSLLNKLLNEDKAIVTDVAGTTRDIVEGKIILNGIDINLIDTAGIRNTKNIVEKIGVEKSKKIIDEADLIIAIFDGSSRLTKIDREILKIIENKKSIIVINKIDLPQNIEIDEIKNKNIINISVANNQNINEIKENITKMFNLKELETEDFTYLSNSRQISLIQKSLEIINEIEIANSKKTEIDLIQIDLQRLWETLKEVTGGSYKEELLDEIFSKFCLGK